MVISFSTVKQGFHLDLISETDNKSFFLQLNQTLAVCSIVSSPALLPGSTRLVPRPTTRSAVGIFPCSSVLGELRPQVKALHRLRLCPRSG